MPRPPRPRGSLPYEKPPLSIDQLVDRLTSRGLQIPDRDRAIRYLRHIGYYRLCAHHGRLWNVGLGVYPAIPNSPSISWLQAPDALPERSRRRLYPVLISLQSVLETVSPRSSWAQRLHTLLRSRSPMNRAGMGVPEHWAEDPFWSRHIE